MVTKKTTTKKATKKVVEEKLLTTEDKIFGVKPTKEVVTKFDYEDVNVIYRVLDLQVENATPSVFNGREIEGFIGCKNLEARKQLKAGAKCVITKDVNGKEKFKIEVL